MTSGQLDGNEPLDLNSLYEDFSKHKNWRKELDEYLSLKRADKNQDILLWWKTHEATFPTISKMARDIFSITATSVPAERLFSLAGLVITKLRNKLNDRSVRALMCLPSWGKSELKTKLKIT